MFYYGNDEVERCLGILSQLLTRVNQLPFDRQLDNYFNIAASSGISHYLLLLFKLIFPAVFYDLIAWF